MKKIFMSLFFVIGMLVNVTYATPLDDAEAKRNLASTELYRANDAFDALANKISDGYNAKLTALDYKVGCCNPEYWLDLGDGSISLGDVNYEDANESLEDEGTSTWMSYAYEAYIDGDAHMAYGEWEEAETDYDTAWIYYGLSADSYETGLSFAEYAVTWYNWAAYYYNYGTNP